MEDVGSTSTEATPKDRSEDVPILVFRSHTGLGDGLEVDARVVGRRVSFDDLEMTSRLMHKQDIIKIETVSHQHRMKTYREGLSRRDERRFAA